MSKGDGTIRVTTNVAKEQLSDYAACNGKIVNESICDDSGNNYPSASLVFRGFVGESYRSGVFTGALWFDKATEEDKAALVVCMLPFSISGDIADDSDDQCEDND